MNLIGEDLLLTIVAVALFSGGCLIALLLIGYLTEIWKSPPRHHHMIDQNRRMRRRANIRRITR